MTKMLTFVEPKGRKFWTVRYNEDSKRVLTVGGRLGTRGVPRRLAFDGSGREEIRAYVDGRIETKMEKGFVQVA
jgi:predicted DNA-binding WGR domain protein